MNNVASLASICDRYQISFLSNLCDEFFHVNLTTKNLCILWKESIRFKVNEFVSKCEQFIRRPEFSANALIKSKQYLTVNQLKLVLESNNSQIKEEDLWEYALKCVDFQTKTYTNLQTEDIKPIDIDSQSDDDNKTSEIQPNLNCSDTNIAIDEYKSHLLQKICSSIRFGLMNAEYFVKKVQPQMCLTKNETIDILDYFICKDMTCGAFSTDERSKTQTFTVARGTVRLTDWHYNGVLNDAICIQTNRNMLLRGIGVFTGNKGIITVKCKIYDGDNTVENQENIVGESDEKIIQCKAKSTVPIELLLRKPVNIKQNSKYTIEILQENSNGASCRVINGQTDIEQNGIKIIITDAVRSDNKTAATGGAIPLLLCTVSNTTSSGSKVQSVLT
eukprot:164280_1